MEKEFDGGSTPQASAHPIQLGSVRVKASGNYQASYRHGGTQGVTPSITYSAPTTFQTEGDARVWLELERRLIETG